MTDDNVMIELVAVSRWRLPRLPIFILPESGSDQGKLPVSAFDEHALRRIGEAWTEALVAKGRKEASDGGRER